MRITETFECMGAEYETWTCEICGHQVTTYYGGEPCCCPKCLDGELLED